MLCVTCVPAFAEPTLTDETYDDKPLYESLWDGGCEYVHGGIQVDFGSFVPVGDSEDLALGKLFKYTGEYETTGTTGVYVLTTPGYAYVAYEFYYSPPNNLPSGSVPAMTSPSSYIRYDMSGLFDTTPPTVNITGKSASWVSAEQGINLKVIASDGSGIKSIKYKIN